MNFEQNTFIFFYKNTKNVFTFSSLFFYLSFCFVKSKKKEFACFPFLSFQRLSPPFHAAAPSARLPYCCSSLLPETPSAAKRLPASGRESLRRAGSLCSCCGASLAAEGRETPLISGSKSLEGRPRRVSPKEEQTARDSPYCSSHLWTLLRRVSLCGSAARRGVSLISVSLCSCCQRLTASLISLRRQQQEEETPYGVSAQR